MNASLVSGLSGPTFIAVSGSNLFVVNTATGTIGKYTTSGETVNASLISGLSSPWGIAVSGSNLFVANYGGGIGEYTTLGETVNASLVSGLNLPVGIAVTNDVPEPSSLVMLLSFIGVGSLSLLGNAWRRQKRAA